jgi:hypothetical protein
MAWAIGDAPPCCSRRVLERNGRLTRLRGHHTISLRSRAPPYVPRSRTSIPIAHACSVPRPPQATRSPRSMLQGWWRRALRLRQGSTLSRTRECGRGEAHVRAFPSPAHSPTAPEVNKSSEASNRTAAAARLVVARTDRRP